MQRRVDYKDELIKQLAFALSTQNKLNEIYNVLKPVSRARDTGIPELGETPLTDDIASKFKQFQQSSTLKECKKLADEVFSFIKGYFKVTFELLSELSIKADIEVDRIENHIDKPIVCVRDFHINPQCAQIIYALTTRFHAKASIQDLQYAFPQYFDEMPQMINTIINKWKGLISFDLETQVVEMNDTDYRDCLALLSHEPLDPDLRLSQLIENHNQEMGAIYYVLENIVPKEYIEFIRSKQRKYFDQNLLNFPTLFTKKQINELNHKHIHTAKDFLEKPYSFFRYNTTLTKAEIIEAKIRLAHKIKWNCKDFELDLIHPSISGDQSPQMISHAIKNLKELFNKPSVTYTDILIKKEILLSPDDSIVRRFCYRLIAFVRDFSERCLVNEFDDFIPYTKNWNYSKMLTTNEVNSLKIKKDIKLMNIINNENTKNDNSTLADGNDIKTQSGSDVPIEIPPKINPQKSKKKEPKGANNEK